MGVQLSPYSTIKYTYPYEEYMITFNIDPLKVIQAVYRYSRPQGLGIIHFQEGELSVEDAKLYIRRGAIYMDYVHGRACKFGATLTEKGVTFSDTEWLDHTHHDLLQLIEDLKKEVT
jgi:hypothetical protein